MMVSVDLLFRKMTNCRYQNRERGGNLISLVKYNFQKEYEIQKGNNMMIVSNSIV